ncbi:MAG TPA: 23S rRNA (uracil(1939)-C(5))-methyltransferase RlmD [Anaerolineae bacterium]|nr:23S rRNA (uracil(1939)-C(5))-methyltransferase RlmD [Anaerolineae bacterium]
MGRTKETVTINALAYGGDGVGYLGEKVLFVPGGVPGDVICVHIKEDRGSYFRGIIDELITPSPERVEPFCPYASLCGSCQWQSLKYSTQLRWKQTIVEESLKRIGGIQALSVEQCLPSPIERNYRTTARYSASVSGGNIIFGYYERHSHQIVDIKYCPVAHEKVNSIAASLKTLINERFPPKDIRELTIQSSLNHNSSLITITTSHRHHLVGEMNYLLTEIPDLSGVICRASPDRHMCTFGERFRYEIIRGRTFRIEERSFFQINAVQTEHLVGLICEMISGEPCSTLIDGYGGVGLFSLSAAHHEAVIHLYDLSVSAVEDSIWNARELGFRYFHAHRKDILSVPEIRETADIIILDPPRHGLGLKAIKAISNLRPHIIIYVSCNPTTLSRDIKLFTKEGYTIERVVPVDMFPHTYHIETVVKLRK